MNPATLFSLSLYINRVWIFLYNYILHKFCVRPEFLCVCVCVYACVIRRQKIIFIYNQCEILLWRKKMLVFFLSSLSICYLILWLVRRVSAPRARMPKISLYIIIIINKIQYISNHYNNHNNHDTKQQQKKKRTHTSSCIYKHIILLLLFFNA